MEQDADDEGLGYEENYEEGDGGEKKRGLLSKVRGKPSRRRD